MYNPRVLVVDDEPNIRDLVQVALRFHGFEVITAGTGGEALKRAREGAPRLLVLDVMLPDLDGFEVCRRQRERGDETPVIFLTARDTPTDTATGRTLGGDDYVTMPFSVDALAARVRAVLRRTAREPAEEVLRVADLELDEARWTVRRAGAEIELSPTEFRLLAYLLRYPGRVLTRVQLLEFVFGWDHSPSSPVVETYVSYQRHKIGPDLIHTQRGVGYALRPPS